jgi:hypothetical protein
LLGAAAVHQHDAALVQRHADREMMARVMSMYTPVLTASPAIGYVQAGLLEPLRPADDGGRQRPRDRAVGLACLLFLQRTVAALAEARYGGRGSAGTLAASPEEEWRHLR